MDEIILSRGVCAGSGLERLKAVGSSDHPFELQQLKKGRKEGEAGDVAPTSCSLSFLSFHSVLL